jgi:hypothetical protein
VAHLRRVVVSMVSSAKVSVDVEELLIEFLSGQGFNNVSIEMTANPPLPFVLINHLTGGDDEVTDSAVVSIHVFDATRTAASTDARALHRAMKGLTAQTPILMSDGSYASIDYLEVVESPHWEDYGDKTIHRYCGRYRVDLRINT